MSVGIGLQLVLYSEWVVEDAAATASSRGGTQTVDTWLLAHKSCVV